MAKEEKMCCGHGKKSMMLGIVVFLIGLLWYLESNGYIAYANLWQVVVMALGILLILKGIIKASMKK